MKRFQITKRDGRWKYRRVENFPIRNGSVKTPGGAIYMKMGGRYFGHQKDFDICSKGIDTEIGGGRIGISYYS